MKGLTLITGLLLTLLFVGACGASSQNNPALAVQHSGTITSSGNNSRELPQATKLALGTFKLDKTDHPVNSEQAAQLLFLWKGMRSLSQEQIAANEEIRGLVKQIQDAMKTEQIDAINAMNLTFQDIAPLGQELGLDFGNFGGQFENRSPEARATSQAARQSGQFQGGGFGGGQIPGSSGGNRPGGGFSGAGGSSAPPTNTTTTSPMRGSGGAFQKIGISPAMIDAVIQFLQAKVK